MIPIISSLAGGGIGSITEGIGDISESNSVEGCGRRPLFGKAKKRAFNDCVESKLDIERLRVEQQLGQQDLMAQNQEAAAKTTKFIVIGAIVIAVIIAFAVIRSSKKK